MWFKNLVLFRLTEPFNLTPEQLSSTLATQAFRPCGGLEASSLGWDRPLGRAGTELVHAANGRIAICVRKEQRLLPAAVVREALEERLEKIEAQEARPVGTRERMRMRDEIVFDLLPRAFTKSIRTWAYISPDDRWLVIDAPSVNRAEELVVLLAQSIGHLGAEPYAPNAIAASEMTRWLQAGRAPGGLGLRDECELREPTDGGSLVRCQRQDLGGEEIRVHLDNHKQVERLGLGFEERLSFVLTADLTVKRLRFEAIDELDFQDTDDEAARFDADFALMTTEIGRLLECIEGIFGAG